MVAGFLIHHFEWFNFILIMFKSRKLISNESILMKHQDVSIFRSQYTMSIPLCLLDGEALGCSTLPNELPTRGRADWCGQLANKCIDGEWAGKRFAQIFTRTMISSYSLQILNR